MKRNILFFALMAILIFSCAKSSKNQKDISSPDIQSKYELKESKKDKNTSRSDEEMSNAENDISDKELDLSQRKIIKNGFLSFVSDDLKKTDDMVNKTVNEYRGYVSSLDYGYNTLRIIARIPSGKFDNFIKTSESFAELKSKKIQTDDVTDQYYDTEARLLTKKKYQEWLRDQYTKAKNIDDLLKFSKKLEEITEDVEAAEGQLRSLTNLTDYSTIEMTFELPYKPDNKIVFNWPNVKNDFADIFFKITMMLYSTLMVILFIIGIIIVIMLIAAVIIPAAGLIFFITFGKLGLVRKFFIKMAGKK